MPRSYPNYPYFEPVASGKTDAQISGIVDKLREQNPTLVMNDGGSLDRLCRAMDVDVEYSKKPCEILLDVPRDRTAVIYLEMNSKMRQDRLATATGIGYWLLHVPPTRKAHPDCGIQALYGSTGTAAYREALTFAYALLMPSDAFKSLWYEGGGALVAETLNVPTQSVYNRAKTLDLSAY